MRVQRRDGSAVKAGDVVTTRTDGTAWTFDMIASPPQPDRNPPFGGSIQVSKDGETLHTYAPVFDLAIVND